MEQISEKTELLSQCPICGGTVFQKFITALDYTVTKEAFKIVKCAECHFTFTNPRPTEDSIYTYYQSTDYISHSNTSKGIINSLYQIARRFAIKKKVKFIQAASPQGKAILDYGCGTGEFLNAMKQAGWKVNGIEPSLKARQRAIQNYNCDVYAPSEIHNLPEKSFDVITLWHVLEHIHKLNKTIEDFKKLLVPGGVLIVAVPNSDAADALLYKEHWAAYDVPRHLYHFNFDSMKRFFSNHQMKIKKALRMPLDAFYVSMLSEKNQNKSLALIRGVVSGINTNLASINNIKKSSSLIFIIEEHQPFFFF